MSYFKIKPAELGEATSLVISMIIMLGLTGYLIYAAFRGGSELLGISSTIGEVVKVAGHDNQFVVPIDINNTGTHGITSLQLDITVEQLHHKLELEYLAAGSSRKVYLYSPTAAQPAVAVTPLSYRID